MTDTIAKTLRRLGVLRGKRSERERYAAMCDAAGITVGRLERLWEHVDHNETCLLAGIENPRAAPLVPAAPATVLEEDQQQTDAAEAEARGMTLQELQAWKSTPRWWEQAQP